MNSAKSIAITVCAALLVSCGGHSGGSSSSTAGSCSSATVGASPSLVTTSATNVIPVYVADPATTGQVGYANEPLVSVTICPPNHTSPSQCQTVSNILLDTGSFGLRVFGSALSVQLTPQTVSVGGQSYQVGQCAVFGSGADWGSVQNADVTMGNQTAVNIPIHVIDSNFASMPSGCAALQPDTDPCSAGYNGILGIGPFSYDCGADCASTDTSVNPGIYFACTGTSCGNVYQGACSGGLCSVAIPTSKQIVNPATQFPTGFNNGVSLTLPSVPVSGASQISGTLTLGIGPAASNVPANAAVVYGADPNGMSNANGMDFLTTFPASGGVTYGADGSGTQAFLDSGSNGLYFPNTAGLTMCPGSSGFYCPASTTALSAVIAGFSGTPTLTWNFSVASPVAPTASSALAGQQSSMFDWGLPFFYGRTVHVGFDGTSATFSGGAATGPYWAF